MREVCVLAVLILATPSLAGPLNPPAGPVASTGRFGPRIEINAQNTPGDADSVYRITQPGSYYLAGNIDGEAFKHGIEIEGFFVTVNLKGFKLDGIVDSLDGISVTQVTASSIVIRNGFLDGWDGAAINCTEALDCRIEDIEVNFQLGDGIVVGQNAKVTNCAVQLAEAGFVAGEGASFTNCRAWSCRGAGFTSGPGSIAVGCSARGNGDFGFTLGNGSVVTECVATSNGFTGINVVNFGVIANCVARGNGATGITGQQNTRIWGCNAFDNAAGGIGASVSSTISGCAAWSNGSTGIGAGTGSLITGCSSFENGTIGIVGPGSGIVTNCIASDNGDHGITISFESVVVNCASIQNGTAVNDGAGIIQRVGGNSWCHIEGNTVAGNDHGVVTTGTRNLIIGNRAANNSVADFGPIPAGNSVGSVLNFQGATVNSTNVYANLRY